MLFIRCESKKQCIQPWVTKCEETPNIGGQKDANGCLIGAGFTWCDVTKQCIQPWVTKCEASNGGGSSDSSNGGNGGNGGNGNGGNGGNSTKPNSGERIGASVLVAVAAFNILL